MIPLNEDIFFFDMRILIVEPDKTQCDKYCKVLSRLGHTCFCAYDGEGAYRMLSNSGSNFDVCLCAVDVPSLDGFLLKRKLNNENNRLPVVFVTNREVPDKELLLKGLAAIRFVPHPLIDEELVRVIDKAFTFNRHIRLRPEFLNPIAKLKLVIDSEKLEPDFLLSTSYTIGRSENADIRVFHRSCSREAAILQRCYEDDDAKKSHYSIVDYSRNGITVNGKKVKSYHELKHGDIIQFSGFEAEYLLLEGFSTHDPKSTLT